jgi:hypothetical protein
MSAASRRSHGPAGTFNLPLALSDAPAIEPRGGASPGVVLTFSMAIEAADGAVNCGQEVVVTGGTCQSATVLGNTLAVNLAHNANACVTIALSGLRREGSGPTMFGDADVQINAHRGNVNADPNVNLLDLQAIKTALFAPVTGTNFKLDVNADGIINLLDLQAVKDNMFQAATCP